MHLYYNLLRSLPDPHELPGNLILDVPQPASPHIIVPQDVDSVQGHIRG